MSVASGMNSLSVLHVGKFYPPYMGGMETHLELLCSELRSTVDVRVVVANSGWKSEIEILDRVEVTRSGTLFNLAGAPICPGMVRSIRESEVDIIHLHLPNPAAVLAYFASGHKGRLVVTYHSDIVRQRVLGAAFEPILHRILDRCEAIIVTSPNYIDSSPVLRAHRNRCHVIPFGIPNEQFQQIDQEAVLAIRERHGPRIVLSVGRLVPYKGFEYLIQAMTRVDAQLVLVGEGPLRARLEQQVKSLGLRDRVVFLGKVPDVIPYYHAADVFALASVARSEAFGIVQIEAMACGTPVVNTRLDSGVPFVSKDGLTGLTVPPANSDALGDALRLLFDDPERREAYGRAAQDRAQREFSLEKMTHRTLQLYSEVLESVPTQKQGSSRRRGNRPAAFMSASSSAG